MARGLLGEEPVEVMAFASRLVASCWPSLSDFDTHVQCDPSGKHPHQLLSRAVYGYDQRMKSQAPNACSFRRISTLTSRRFLTRTGDDVREPLTQRRPSALRSGLQGETRSVRRASAYERPLPTSVQDGRKAPAGFWTTVRSSPQYRGIVTVDSYLERSS